MDKKIAVLVSLELKEKIKDLDDELMTVSNQLQALHAYKVQT